MVTHVNAYLEQCPGFGWEGGAEFSTNIVSLENGSERRNVRWSQARRRYSAPYNNISQEAYEQINQVFHVCFGPARAFRFVDQLDEYADDAIFGTGTGGEVEFQLGKLYEAGGVTHLRYIHALRLSDAPAGPWDAPVVRVNGTPVSATFDYDRGRVIFDEAPELGDVLTWSGFFDVWVRFQNDFLPFSIDNPRLKNGTIDVQEVAAPPLEVVSG